MSRTKGASGEREVVRLATHCGLSATRTAPLQTNSHQEYPPGDIELTNFPTLHCEIKRDERLSVDAMVRQAKNDAAKATRMTRVPVVFWRRNRGEWRADVPLSWLFHVLRLTKRPKW